MMTLRGVLSCTSSSQTRSRNLYRALTHRLSVYADLRPRQPDATSPGTINLAPTVWSHSARTRKAEVGRSGRPDSTLHTDCLRVWAAPYCERCNCGASDPEIRTRLLQMLAAGMHGAEHAQEQQLAAELQGTNKPSALADAKAKVEAARQRLERAKEECEAAEKACSLADREARALQMALHRTPGGLHGGPSTLAAEVLSGEHGVSLEVITATVSFYDAERESQLTLLGALVCVCRSPLWRQVVRERVGACVSADVMMRLAHRPTVGVLQLGPAAPHAGWAVQHLAFISRLGLLCIHTRNVATYCAHPVRSEGFSNRGDLLGASSPLLPCADALAYNRATGGTI